MGKLKRGGYIFKFWKGDHPPRHVHVYKDKFVLKWDLENNQVIEGSVTKKIRKLIDELVKEGKL